MSTTTRFVPTGSTASVIKVFLVHGIVALVSMLAVLTVLADAFTLGQSTILLLLAVVIFAVQPLTAVLAYQHFEEE